MAAPEYVPINVRDEPRSYKSPPWRTVEWRADRPAEVVESGQPRGHLLGSQGPDQGYVWKLVRLFDGKLVASVDERREDVIAGCVGVALKRASLFGRAPVVHDLTVAFTVWGLMQSNPSADLIELRRTMFEGVSNPHHYPQLRAVVDAVPEATLRLSPDEAASKHTADWRALLAL
jgi:hypothetical protein